MKMFNKLLTFIKGFLSCSHGNEFNNGLLWARSRLESASPSRVEEMEAYVYGSTDPFDKGVMKGIREYEKLHECKNCRCSIAEVKDNEIS